LITLRNSIRHNFGPDNAFQLPISMSVACRAVNWETPAKAGLQVKTREIEGRLIRSRARLEIVRLNRLSFVVRAIGPSADRAETPPAGTAEIEAPQTVTASAKTGPN
jgi:hypothetical protein